ncbi:MAG: hypothetical protein Q9218_003097 [Villophora microphyllina]
MGELASMAPTSGGQYHWASMLAPSFCKKFVSYIMGWLVICGWQAILAGSAYLGGNMILALAQLNYPNYSPRLWHGTLVYWGVMAVAIGINTAASKLLPKIESFILGLHILGFLAILIPLVHMAEEIHGANVVIPWCMLSTTLLNGILGFAMVQSDTAIPLYAIFVMALVSCLIGLINIGSSTAFNDVISLGVSSLYASYVLTEALLLYHRIIGNIRHPKQMAGSTWQANELVWGPFHVPGIWGILLNAFGVGYGIIVFIFSFFPQSVKPDAAHMNFSCLMTGAIMFFAVIYYHVYARQVYTGPVVEIAPYQIS